MGPVSTLDLAIAVAESGGIGSITALGMPADALDTILVEMTSRTDGVLAANFLTAGIDRDAVAAAAARARIVDFFWADPDASLVEIVHRAGALACWQVGSLDEAKAATDAGCDLLAAQGIEAGGHVRGTTPIAPLLDAILGAVDVPVLAAGGVGDGAALAAQLAAGAAGARIGTRFVATAESGAHPLYKQAIVDAEARSTEITDAFAVCPLCATSPRARVLRASIDAVAALRDEVVGEGVIAGQRVALPRGAGLPPTAACTGHIDAMALYAGESVAAIRSVATVAQVIDELTVSLRT